MTQRQTETKSKNICLSDIKEALINLQKLLKAIKEHQTKDILQRFLKF